MTTRHQRLTRWGALVLATATAGLGLALSAPAGAAPAEPAASAYWHPTNAKVTQGRKANRPHVAPTSYAAYTLERERLSAVLRLATPTKPVTVQVPAPTKKLASFSVREISVMEPKLAAANPQIRTFAGRSTADPHTTIRLDLTPLGFHASVRGPGSRAAWSVDPAGDGTDGEYVSYLRKNLARADRRFVEPELPKDVAKRVAAPSAAHRGAAADDDPFAPSATYRLALANDHTYADYWGDDDAVLASKVTATNRLDHIYNEDHGIRFVLVENSRKLNFDTTEKERDPHGACGPMSCFRLEPPPDDENGAPISQLAECNGDELPAVHAALGQIVGAENYDVGHMMLHVPGGGVAAVGAGGEAKGYGCTSADPPAGDGYVVDFMAHEIGHQFGADHSFNAFAGNCRHRAGWSSTEPGSGSSIMAYAGICGDDNLQMGSDPYFAATSVAEVRTYRMKQPVRIDEHQVVTLRSLDDADDAYRLRFDGKETQPITLETSTVEGVQSTLDEAYGVGNVQLLGYDYREFNGSQYQLLFQGKNKERDVPLVEVVPDGGDVAGSVTTQTIGGTPPVAGRPNVSGNHVPTVTVPEDKTIPIRTPFALTGSATDSDGDPLIHTWEQDDAAGEQGTSLLDPVKKSGPLFRMFGSSPALPGGVPTTDRNKPTADVTRSFPDMHQILVGDTNAATGTCPEDATQQDRVECFSEFLPTKDYGSGSSGESRPSLTFVFTARDQNAYTGGFAVSERVRLHLEASAGPFLVSSQASADTSVAAGGQGTVTWDVAHTEKLAANVRVTLSTDGGETFSHVLAESVPNSGSATVTWPSEATDKARIKVEAVDNYFFDVNDAPFTITAK